MASSEGVNSFSSKYSIPYFSIFFRNVSFFLGFFSFRRNVLGLSLAPAPLRARRLVPGDSDRVSRDNTPSFSCCGRLSVALDLPRVGIVGSLILFNGAFFEEDDEEEDEEEADEPSSSCGYMKSDSSESSSSRAKATLAAAWAQTRSISRLVRGSDWLRLFFLDFLDFLDLFSLPLPGGFLEEGDFLPLLLEEGFFLDCDFILSFSFSTSSSSSSSSFVVLCFGFGMNLIFRNPPPPSRLGLFIVVGWCDLAN